MLVQLMMVLDVLPSEEDIVAAVRSLHAGITGGPLRMQSEHLKMWLREATREKNLDRAIW